ncbi:MAG TPA: c-type cytochrome [Steroidobacteraceae bacterium]|jgi:cytochrome c553|nr:c-type cytochrome [Steroidobacteraceae bacterium]
MSRALLAFALALCGLDVGVAAERPEWAFFVPADAPPPKGSALSDPFPAQWSAPGSTRSYSGAQLQDPLNPPDWYPSEHPQMPPVVAHGSKAEKEGPPVLPCALCHLPNGAGHVESASLAGLPSNYILHQLDDIRSGTRQITVGGPHAISLITTLKKGFAQEQLPAAARYFSSLKPRTWIRVVEAYAVPKSFVSPDSLMRLPVPNGGTEPLGRRIVELPESALGLIARDSHSGYVAYVPEGSIAAGEVLVNKGGPGRTLACASCHGAKLTGLGDVPALAGRPPSYIARQLWAFQSGARAGSLSAGMKPVVANLTAEEMLDIAAYLASVPPR